jgi:hypothetical protein
MLRAKILLDKIRNMGDICSIRGIDLSMAAAGGERSRRLFEPSRPQPAARAAMAAKFFI